MICSFVIAVVAVWGVSTTNSSVLTAGLSSETVENFVQITAVNGNRISVVESTRSGNRGRAMESQNDNNSIGRSGRRRGTRGKTQNNQSGNNTTRRNVRGRSGMRSIRSSRNRAITIPVGDDVRVTYALQERRTNEFRVGADINGRLKNDIFKKIPAQGLTARIVSDGTRLIEVNIIQENDTSTDDIAVKPKRPPRARN